MAATIDTTTHAQRLAELRRELQMKQQYYPDWVRNKKLAEGTAAHRIQCFIDVLEDLAKLYALLPPLIQGTLFTPDQLPTKQTPTAPTRGQYADH